MLELARQKEEYCRINVSKQEALEHFNSINETYKVELINDLEDGKITYYRQGSFTDLCRGPHLPDTSYIKAIKLTGLAGAYWRGNEHNKMLTRIYGITFPKQKMLDEWLVLMEEAKQRDHRKIGKEMELFTFSQAVGAGLPMWLPKGAMLRERLEGFLRKVQQIVHGYLKISSNSLQGGNVRLAGPLYISAQCRWGNVESKSQLFLSDFMFFQQCTHGFTDSHGLNSFGYHCK